MRGFSLVELSIVLVILGLLTGGILAGQSLIRAAELRSVSTEFQQWKIAAGAFQNKYFAIPGDFRDATRFWGYEGGDGCVSNTGIATTADGTCDGNGDGRLGPNPVVYNITTNRREWFAFWHQLGRAGLISGQYTGIPLTGSERGGHIPGENCPAARLSSSSCWSVIHVADSTSVGDSTGGSFGQYFPGQHGNLFILGRPTTRQPVHPVISGQEMWNIDMKIDDGRPDQGMLMAGAHNTSCHLLQSGEMRYSLTSSGQLCTLIFNAGF